MSQDTQHTPDLREDAISQLPALKLMQNLGYEYLTPEEALKHRGVRAANVILEGILVPWLREYNRIQFKDGQYPFTEGNILSAVQALKEIPYDGLIRTS